MNVEIVVTQIHLQTHGLIFGLIPLKQDEELRMNQ